MADVAAQLTVVIDAIDNASGVIAGVAAELGGLGSIGNTAAGSTAAVNSALDNTARSGTAAGSALTAAARGGTTLVQSQERVISTAEKWKTSGKNLKEFGEGVDTLTKPLQAAAVAAVGLGIATGKAAVDFEDNFAAVEKTVDGTPEQLENIKQGIIDMTTVGINGHSAIPQTTADLTELAAAGGQLGVQTENILDFTETMAMLGTATNLSGEAGAKTLARFMNVTNTAQSDISRLGSTIVDLGNNFATTEAEIANMAMDMGATGSEIGMSTQDILGYATALSSMGIEAAAGGSALQRIWMDMQNAVSSGGDSLEAFAKISGKSSKDFQDQWKKDASGAFRDFLKGLNESEDKVGLLTALGFNNVRDQRALMALAGEEGFNILTEAINRANKAWNENTALQNEFDKKAETTKSQIEVTKNNVIEAARSFGEVLLPEVAAATGGIADFAKGLADMDEGSKKAVITGAKSAIILGAVAKGTTSVIKGTGNLIESIGKIKGAFATGGALAEVSPTLGAIATGAGPAVLGLATVAAATYGMAKAAKAFEDYRADWSRGGDELTAELKSHVDAARELNELQYELRTLNQITSNPDTNAEDLEAAQARINEIKQTLAQKYHMDIEVDSSQLDAALEKQKELEYYDAVGRVPKQLNYLDDKKDDYEKAKEGIAKAKENIAAIEAEQDATRRLRADLVSLKEKYDKGQISQKEFTQGIKELAEAAGNPYLADTPIDALINGDAIDDWAERLQDYLKTNTDTLANGEATLAEYVKSAEELADTGLMQMEWGKTEQGLANIASAVKYAGLNVDEYAKKASNVETGVTSMSEAVQSAWEGNGEVLDKYIGNYMNFAQKFGASTEQAVEGAALIKEGFSSVAEVGNNADNIQAVLNSLQQLGSVQGLDMNAEKLTEMAHEMKLLPDNMHIEFDAEGKITWKPEEAPEPDVPDAEGTVNYETGEVEEPDVPDAEGTVNYETGEVEKPEDLTVEGTVNWTIAGTEMTQMPTFDSLPEIETTQEVTVSYTADYSGVEEPPEKNGKAVYTGDFAGVSDAPLKSGTAAYTGDFSGIGSPPPLEGTVVYHAVYEKQAQGTQNFGGGLAMLNDETGVADKRELVIDQGRAFIPQGENVIMALSKGAKVYTASQTKRIMASLGIAQYASGKDNHDLLGTLAQFGLSGITVQKSLPENVRTHEEYLYEWQNGGSMAGAPNSETFEEAKEEWEHYKRTHALTVSEEMQKQIEFAHEFNETEADIADIEEEIFSLARKTSEELNEQSKSYIVDRSALNDWEAYGDSAIAAFDRVRDRNLQDYHDGLITWQEYTENMSDIGSAMYDERRDQSENWLDHEEKYNGMSAADYIAGIDRMQQYTQEYYDNGIITYREFVEAKTDLDEQRLDKYKELLDEQFNISKDYISEHTYFNDWGDLGDDPLAAYNSVKEHMDAALASSKLTEEEYKEYMSGLGTEMYDWRREQSGNWLDEQRKYFGMEADAYIEGLEREKIYTEKYYRLGLINRREFNEGMTDLNHKMWDEAAAAYDDMLDKQSEYISDLREQFSDEEQALRDSWEVEDRAVDMSEVAEQLAIYEGAVTDRGQQKYKDLQEEMLQLQRDEELYNLQVKNNAIIESLEAEYEQLEADKTAYLKGIAENTNIDISGIVSDITSGIEQSSNSITHTLSEIIDAIHGIKMEQQNYTDSRQINITTSDAAVMSRFMGAM